MKDALIVTALSLVPRNAVARRMGWFARTPVSRWFTSAFVRIYGVDLSEADGEMADYTTLESLFTRTLKDGARPVDSAVDALVSPVDGRVAALGSGSVELAPGKTLDLSELLGREGGGEVAVLYLSPKDYHRVHVPREGRAVDWSYLPGTLWPVFPAAVRGVDGLFSRNERLRVGVETEVGRIEVVLVGAFGVGRIEVAVADVTSNAGQTGQSGELDHPLGRGDWLGTFHLGSTVILVLPEGKVTWDLQVGDAVRMGERLGTLC